MKTPSCMLFVPGSDERKLAKTETLAVPALILDLEDAVAVDAKPRARRLVADYLGRYRGDAELHVRVNGLLTPFTYDDLQAVCRPGLAGLLLPKVEASWEVRAVDWALSALETQHGMKPGSTQLTATLETVRGIHEVAAIAAASPRLVRLVFGCGDYSTELGLAWPDSEWSDTITAAKVAVVTASRVAGLQPPDDGVYPVVRDLEGLRREAVAAQRLGFHGKHTIHPSQVPVVIDAFQPSNEELARARRIIDAFTSAEREGIAAIEVDGQFVDYPVVTRAKRLLEDSR